MYVGIDWSGIVFVSVGEFEFLAFGFFGLLVDH